MGVGTRAQPGCFVPHRVVSRAVPRELARPHRNLPTEDRATAAQAQGRKAAMVTITCPWCDEDELFRLADLAPPGMELVCPACGTAVILAMEPDPPERALA